MNFFRIPPVPPAIFTFVAGVVHQTVWPFEPLTEPWHLISGGIIIAIAGIMFGASDSPLSAATTRVSTSVNRLAI